MLARILFSLILRLILSIVSFYFLYKVYINTSVDPLQIPFNFEEKKQLFRDSFQNTNEFHDKDFKCKTYEELIMEPKTQKLGDVLIPAAVYNTATDDYTLEIQLNSPCAYFLDLLAFPTYLPVYEPEVEAANPDGTTPGAWAQEAGFTSNGAFTLTSWTHNESMVYEKNPNFYRADDVKLEKLEFMLSADDTAIYAAYNSGDLDFADTVPTDEVGSLLDNPEFNIIDTLGTYYVGLNVNSDLFDGLTATQASEMREALSLLIDRQYIVDTVGQTGQVPADTFIPDGMADGNGGVFEADDFGYYDATTTGASMVDDAVALLEDCGYTFESDGNGGYTISPALSVTYLTNSGTGHEAIAQCIQQDWGLVGIEVNVEVEDWNVFLEDRK